jgi:segregation and condensation protein B
MRTTEGTAIVEAILFASGEPLSIEKIAAAAGFDLSLTERLIDELRDRLRDTGSALTVLRLGKEYQLAATAKYYEYIKKAFEERRSQPLSQAALEVLTIAAYNQPVTKGFVENVRGVDSSYIVNNLTEKGLLEEAGRLDVPGHPVSYRTTTTFLRAFGLSSIEELPPVPSGKGEQISIEETETFSENSMSNSVSFSKTPPVKDDDNENSSGDTP